MYSYADLLLLLAALHSSAKYTVGVSLLWFGFLIHLEWQHRDRGRALWSWYAWVIPWIAGLALLHSLWSIIFILLAVTYSLKKKIPQIAWISFLYNGALKGALVVGLTSSWLILIGIVIIMAGRNLAGDFRDAGKDRSEGIRSLPVILGVKNNVPFVYPIALAITSSIWTAAGGLPLWMLMAALGVQAATYKLTPR
jgi:4-hydroxybenzoate polyprenyltransferase